MLLYGNVSQSTSTSDSLLMFILISFTNRLCLNESENLKEQYLKQ